MKSKLTYFIRWFSHFSANAVYCSGVGFGPSDSDWLMWLCIAFGILFGVMLLINIFLCSAMTCSCTRSEIIEKEPSVYDDYSIYDSQYGKKTGILLPKLFWTTVRKNCFTDREKLSKFKVEGREFAKFLR